MVMVTMTWTGKVGSGGGEAGAATMHMLAATASLGEWECCSTATPLEVPAITPPHTRT
jgi:hypothetical protein